MPAETITKPPILDETGQVIVTALANVTLVPQIVDNLTTQDPSKILSANQGYVLNSSISSQAAHLQIEIDNDRGEATPYSTSTSYVAGDYCIYNDTLYKCIGATSGSWDSAKWQAMSLKYIAENSGNDIHMSVSNSGNLEVTFTVEDYDTTKSYDVGDYCVYDTNKLQVCISPTTGAYDSTKWETVKTI